MYNIKEFSLKRLLYAVLINVILICIALFVFVPFFEEIDDTHVAMIAEGAYGVREWHLIYPNIILGKIYVFLSSMMPYVRWHTVIQYVFIFIAYVLTTYVISKHKYGYLISLSACLSTFYEMYVSLQYTKTASFVTTCGLILIYENVRNSKYLSTENNSIISISKKTVVNESRMYAIAGVIFLIYGGLLRQEAFLIACIPMFFVGCIELARTKMFLNYFKVLVPVFVAVVLVIFANNKVYQADSNWSDFMEYNKVRMQLTDYRYDILDYPSNGEKLKELGVSENDAWLIVTYQFGDDSIFSTEYMQQIRNLSGRREFSIQILKNLWESIGNEIKRNTVIIPALLCFVILLIVTIVSERTKSDSVAIAESRMKMAVMFGIGALSAMALIYFQYSGRWSHRLAASLVIPAIYAICYMLDSPAIKEEDRGIIFGGNIKDRSVFVLGIAIVISVVFNVVCYKININDYSECKTLIEDKNMALTEFNDNSDVLYVIDTFTFQNSFKYDVFNPVVSGEMKNVVSCGSWFMNSPITKRVCESFGCTNPYDALINDNVQAVLLDTYFPDEKAQFLTEHYNKLYNAVKVGNINNITEYVMEISK